MMKMLSKKVHQISITGAKIHCLCFRFPDTFLKWTPSDNVSSKVEPFITWLKEAEEEEDDE